MNCEFKEMGVTLDNIKEFEEKLAEYKKGLKETAKTEVAGARVKSADATNDAIKAGTLEKGTKVVVIYNKKEVVGELKTTPTADTKNLAVISDEFANKEKFAYIPKYNFVRIAE